MSEYGTLISAARQARENAHAPYSNFVLARRSAPPPANFWRCNVENATYGLTVCAERIAIFKALSEGERGFDAISVVTDTETLTPPCGACRQLIWNFARRSVILANLKGKTEIFQMRELFPKPLIPRIYRKWKLKMENEIGSQFPFVAGRCSSSHFISILRCLHAQNAKKEKVDMLVRAARRYDECGTPHHRGWRGAVNGDTIVP